MWRLKGAVAQKAAGLVSRADCWPGGGHGLCSGVGGFKSRQAPRLAKHIPMKDPALCHGAPPGLALS